MGCTLCSKKEVVKMLSVMRKKINKATISERNQNGLVETLYLYENKENYRHLMKSLSEYKKGMVSVHEVAEK